MLKPSTPQRMPYSSTRILIRMMLSPPIHAVKLVPESRRNTTRSISSTTFVVKLAFHHGSIGLRSSSREALQDRKPILLAQIESTPNTTTLQVTGSAHSSLVSILMRKRISQAVDSSDIIHGAGEPGLMDHKMQQLVFLSQDWSMLPRPLTNTLQDAPGAAQRSLDQMAKDSSPSVEETLLVCSRQNHLPPLPKIWIISPNRDNTAASFSMLRSARAHQPVLLLVSRPPLKLPRRSD